MQRSIVRLAALCVALLAGVSCRSSSPRAGPPAPPAPAPTATPDSTPAVVIFTYRPGRAVYDYTSSATVALDGDTAGRPERVNTHAVVSLEIGAGGDALPLLVVVDSFAVTSTARIAPTEQRLASPIRITGTVAPRTGALRLSADSADCTSPAGAVRLIAREVLPSIRDTLAVGRRWSDTTATLSCRGGALLRSRGIASYTVDARDERTNPPILRLSRRSTVTVDGTAGQGTSPPTVHGSGTESATFDLDAGTGRVNGMRGESNIAFQVTIGQRTQRFVQTATQELRPRNR